MKLLLDTHIWLWSLLEPKNLSRRVVKALESPDNELWLSPLSVWELLVLVEKGRLALDLEVGEWISRALSVVPLKEAPITYDVALETGRVQVPHRDPVDRFLAATAKVFELTLVTADQRLIGTKGISILSSR